VSGLLNNIDFLISTIKQKDFIEAKATTAFFDNNMSNILTSLNTSYLSPPTTDNTSNLSPNTTNSNNTSNISDILPFIHFAIIAINLIQIKSNLVSNVWKVDNNAIAPWRGFNVTTKQVIFNDNLETKLTSTRNNNELIITVNLINSKLVIPALINTITLINYELINNLIKNSIVLKLKLVIDNLQQTGVVSIYKNISLRSDVIDIWIDGREGEKKTHYQLIKSHEDYTNDSSTGGSSNPVIISPMPG
jgi:hypothetical protein